MTDLSQQFPLGLTGEVSVVVSQELTARHLGSGAVAVFATPEMVRFMERAAVCALAEHLAPGQQSVGVMVDIKHLAATPVGAKVTARAELIAVNRRRLTFRVAAFDGIETIGEGTHERAIIDLEQFEARVAAKAGKLQSEQDAS